MRLITKQQRDDWRNAEIKLLREKHNASVMHVYNLIIVKYESQFREGIRPCVQIWRSNAARAHINYYFRSEEKRQAFIEDQIRRAESHVSFKIKQERERKNDKSIRNRRNETMAVKKTLAELGIGTKVTHGRGTAYGWLEINIGAGQQFGEHEIGEHQSHAHCRRCKINHLIRDFVLNTICKLTGRGGEYHGNVLVLTQDDWSDKLGCSIPIEHDLEKLFQSIPEIKEVI